MVCPVYDTLSPEDEARFGSQRFNAAGFVPRPHGVALERFLLSSVGRLGDALRFGAYVQDASPAFYVYGIRYQPPIDVLETIEPDRRRAEYLLLGLVGVLDLDRVGHGEVALHERTFSDRVDERVALADATGMNFAPIMAGYNVPDHRINNHLEEFLGLDRSLLAFDSSVPPVVSARMNGTSHLLWRIEDPSVIRAVEEDLSGVRLLILDGHHRYTGAAKRHHEGQVTRPLVMLVEGGDRALQLLPWHRVLPGDVVAHEAVFQAARGAFPDTRSLGPTHSVESVVSHLHEMTAEHRRGFVLASPEAFVEVPGQPSGDVGADFDQLHAFLEDELSLDPHELEFVRSPRRALERAAASPDSPAGTAFLLPGLTEPGVEARAFGQGRLMAHKSTMFLPKVAEGVIFAPVDGVG